ncbi:MAG: LPS-assembly protein LptD [Candidatus Kuenenia sp.]|nr:LPS-assembly protein LptD [Candidatus Kuenenia hertensis]
MKTIRFLFILVVFFSLSVSVFADSLLSVSNIAHRPFSLSAKRVSTWKKEGIRVFVAEKNVSISQGPFRIVADNAVCWFHEEESLQNVDAIIEVYCEGDITMFHGENYEKFEQVYQKFVTMTGIEVSPDISPIASFESEQQIPVFLRGEEIRLRGEEEYLSMEIPDRLKTQDQREKEELIDIIADHIDSWEEEDGRRIIVALGNVKIKKEDMDIDADSVILWFDKSALPDVPQQSIELPLSEIYAEGNVTMRRENDFLIADRIFEQTKEDRGIIIDGKIKTTIQSRRDEKTSDQDIGSRTKKSKSSALEDLPAHVAAEEIRHVGKGQYELKNGRITTCGYGHPHYHFKGKKIRLIQSEEHNIVSSKHNYFYLGQYPLAYFPYLSLDIQEKEKLLKEWEFGSSSRFGTFIRTDWDLYAATGGRQKEWSDLIFKLDYLQERGLGTGFDFGYRGKDLFGFVDTYYLNDHGEYDINRIPVDEEDRGSILWRQRQMLPYNLRMDMEYSYLSDPRFLREYFQHEFKTEKDHETVFYLRRIQDNKAATFLVNQQFNGFDTTVDSLREHNYAERLPEAKYQIISEPLMGNRVLFSSENSITYFNNSVEQSGDSEKNNQTLAGFNSGTVNESVETQPVARIDSVARLSFPFKPWFFNVKPFVEGRVTGYSESLDTSSEGFTENGNVAGRLISSFGLDWSSTHWRTYSVYNDFFKINRLRHIFIPELRYINSPFVSLDPSELYQYDEIDALDSSQILVMGVKNKLQTKRGRPGYEKTVDFIDFNIDYYMFPTNSGIYTEGINGIIVRKDNFINLDFRCQLTDIVTFISERNEFNTEEFQFDVLSYGVEVFNPPDWQFFAGHRFIRDISSTIILAADYQISEKWSIMGREKYDLKSSLSDETDDDRREERKNLKTSLVLSRYFHDWIGSLTLELDPIRNDNSYRFDITPKGLQERTRRFWF